MGRLVDAPLGLFQRIVDFLLGALQKVEVVVLVGVIEEVQSPGTAQVRTAEVLDFAVLQQNRESAVLVLVSGQLEGVQFGVHGTHFGGFGGQGGDVFVHRNELAVGRLDEAGGSLLFGFPVSEDEVKPEGEAEEGHDSDDGQVQVVRLLGVGVSKQEEVHQSQQGQEHHHKGNQEEHDEILPGEEPSGVSVALLVQSEGPGISGFPPVGQITLSAGGRRVDVLGVFAELGDHVHMGLAKNVSTRIPHVRGNVFPHGFTVFGQANCPNDAGHQNQEEEHIVEKLTTKVGQQNVQKGQHQHDDGQNEDHVEQSLVRQEAGLVPVLRSPPLDILVMHNDSEGEAEGSQGGEEEHRDTEVVFLDGHGEDIESEDNHAGPDDQGKGSEHDELVLLLLPFGVEVLAPLAAPVVRVGLHFPHVGLVEGHVQKHRDPGDQEEDHHQESENPDDQLHETRRVVLRVS